MKQRQIRPELILLFAIGFQPKHLIKLGYSEQTVYKYKTHFENAKAKILEILIKKHNGSTDSN